MKYTNQTNIPIALAVWLARDEYDYSENENEISVTTLLKPVRQIILSKRLPVTEQFIDIGDIFKSRMGTALHNAIEQSWLTHLKPSMKALGYPDKVIDRIVINPEKIEEGQIPVYLEQRKKKQIGKWTISGKFDFVGEGRVQDFKSTGTFTYTNQTNAEKYSWQGSMYRYLCPEIITENEMQIHYLFTDWSKLRAIREAGYPQTNPLTQSYTLKSIQETEAYIKGKLTELEKYWDAPEEDIPNCSDEDLWRDPPVWKYYKNPNNLNRSTKNFETRQEAIVRFVEDGSVGLVKEVKGKVTACKYCPAATICSQKNQYILSGELTME